MSMLPADPTLCACFECRHTFQLYEFSSGLVAWQFSFSVNEFGVNI